MKNKPTARPGARGFSLIELLVVVGLIAILAATGLPNAMAYLRLHNIRAAASGVKSQIETARLKAVSLNADYGVLFVAVSPTSYRYVIEDTFPQEVPRRTLTRLLADPEQAGPLHSLPSGVIFDTACTLTGGAFTPTDAGFRFSRLGLWCDPGASPNCPALTSGAGQVAVLNTTAGASICLREPNTGLERVIQVSTGGRVEILQ